MVLSCSQMRNLEQKAVDAGATYLSLMEEAGTAAACWILEKYPGLREAAILCGKGNNGGDGFVIARRLCQSGVRVSVLLLEGQPATECARQNFERLQGLEAEVLAYDSKEAQTFIAQAEAIVDAVYGIGFRGALREQYVPFFECVNKADAVRFSIDLPSGAQGDSGMVEGVCFQADYTISFTALKPAHVLYPAADYCGEVTVAQVGIPEKLLKKSPYVMEETSLSQVKAALPPRRASAHKGSFGTLLCLCGSVGMSGAAIMSLTAAVRCGAGLVHAAVPESIYPIAAARLSEPVFTLCRENNHGGISRQEKEGVLRLAEKATACLIGCGMGNWEDTRILAEALLSQAEIPLVIDADGINAISAHIDVLKTARAPVIITPHPGEMARLLGISTQQVQLDRLNAAQTVARKYAVVTVLKGANTLVALPDGQVFVNRTGNPGMARGGSGDVLAGMIASFLAQGIPADRAALCGVYLHGLAGDRCAAKLSQTAMTPTDLLCELPSLFLECVEDRFPGPRKEK